MILLFYLLLILFLQAEASNEYSNKCSQRCNRIHDRSLSKIHFDNEKVDLLFEKQKPLGTLRDVCWRMYDHLDCMKRCPSSKEHEKLVRRVRFKCRSILSDIEDKLVCINRYHSFIEVRCSSFVNEAIRRREKQSLDLTPDKETCRYLHLNSLCLENTVNNFCPRTKKIFRRLNFRDYFLNFIIPENDLLFDDEDLDSCQIYNFVKTAGKSDAVHVDEELTTLRSRLEVEDTIPTKVTFFVPSSSRMTEKQAFSELLNDLLSTNDLKTDAMTTPMTLRKKIKDKVSRNSSNSETHDEMETTTIFSHETTDVIEKLLDSIEKTARKTLESLEVSEKPKNISEKEDDMIDNQLSFMDVLDDDEDEAKEQVEDQVEDEDDETPETQITASADSIYSTAVEFSTVPTMQTTTSNKKLFSDDSMEHTPPNFRYSSMRAHRYTVPMSTGRAEDVVTPINLDTSTMFGEEFTSAEEKKPQNYVYNKNNDEDNIEITTISLKPSSEGSAPLLNKGHVIRKPILSWNEEDKSQDNDRVNVVKSTNVGERIIDDYEEEAEDDDNDDVYENNDYEEEDEVEDVAEEMKAKEMPAVGVEEIVGDVTLPNMEMTEKSEKPINWSEKIFNGKKLLMLIYLILLAILIISLVFGFFFCFSCRRRSCPTPKY